MNNLISLIKKNLMENYSSIYHIKSVFRIPKKRNKFLINTVILLSALFVLMRIIYTNANIFEIYKANNKQELFLMTIFIAFSVILMFFTIPYVVSKVYFSRDTEVLLSMPIKVEDIIISRLISIAISNMLIGVVVCLPFIIKYGISENANILFYIYAFINIMIVDLTIIFFTSIIVLLFMSILSIGNKMKDLLKFLGMVIMIVLILGIQILTHNTFIQENSNENIFNLITNSENIIERISMIFINLKFSVKSIINYNNINGLVYLVISFAILIILYLIIKMISGKLLLKGLQKEKEVRKNKKIKEIDKKFKKNTIIVSIAKKEIIQIFKTPIYLFNTLFSGIIVPFAMALPIFLQLKKEGIQIFEISNMIREIIEQMPKNYLIYTSIIAGFCFSAFLGTVSSILPSTFSREGKKIWILQVLPVEPKEQILGRILANEICLLIATIPSIIIGLFIVRFPVYIYIIFIISVLILMIPVGLLQMEIDLLIPKLDWIDPQEAIKQNFGIFISVFVTFGLIALAIISYIFLFSNIMSGILAMTMYFIGLIIVSSIILYLILRNSIKKRFNFL